MKSVRLEDLPLDVKALCQHSLEARKASYSPYSQFKVGAALLSEDGKLVTGCNVENASYGLAICAERTACVKAISEVFKNYTVVPNNFSIVLKIYNFFHEVQFLFFRFFRFLPGFFHHYSIFSRDFYFSF